MMMDKLLEVGFVEVAKEMILLKSIIYNTMGHTREKKPIAYVTEAKEEAKRITEDFIDFADGVRVMMLIHRSKDGATHSTRHLRMIFTSGVKEFENALGSMIEEMTRSIIEGLRIYCTMNSRDMKKAIRQFKHDQLDTEDFSEHDQHEFYLGIKSRFSSALMRPNCRETSFFLFDVDDPMTLDEALGIFARCPEKPEIVKQYKTKNGWHIITKPFNYTQLETAIPVQKDGILLLKY